MARAIWKGSISFGLVSIPVGLYTAENAQELNFHMLDRRNLAPVRYLRVNEETGKEVPWDQIVKGYEFESGKYVVMSDADFERANPEATQSVDILGFAKKEEIDPIYYEKPYYLSPLKRGEKGYALLREVLRRTGRVGIASVVIRSKQHLATLLVEGQLLVLMLLRYSHEIRKADDLEVPEENLESVGVKEKEVEMAERLVEGMAEPWEPEKYKDDYRDDLLALINKRIESGETEQLNEAEPVREKKTAKVVDMMELLKRSIEEKGKGKTTAKMRTKEHEIHPKRSPSARASAPRHHPKGTKVRKSA